MNYRPIEPSDNQALARLIRSVFEEFGIARPGTVYTDPTTDQFFELFQQPGSAYWVVEAQDELLGGCGIFPTEGLPKGCAELVKLYLKPAARGKGVGKALMDRCFETAKALGYTQVYLETLPELGKAVGMYEKAGFYYLDAPLGQSGHFGCDIWMLKDLSA